MTAIRHLPRPDGLRLAYRYRPGTGPTLVFLPGYASDMAGSKATALHDWAVAEGRACLLLDYSGCGASEGAFEDGTLNVWRDDALHLIDTLTQGPLLLVGSSMGGWLMLLVALARRDRVAGLIGLADAPDFTRWDFDADKIAILLRDGRIAEPSLYGPEPMIVTRAFWESGEANLLLEAGVDLACPVRLLHGQADPDVPWRLALDLAAALGSADVQVTLVKDGDHRLSRDSDIALLLATVQRLMESL